MNPALIALGSELAGWIAEYLVSQGAARGTTKGLMVDRNIPTSEVYLNDRVLLSTSGGWIGTGNITVIHDFNSATIHLDDGRDVIASRGNPGWVKLP